jgi:hypothetical protein
MSSPRVGSLGGLTNIKKTTTTLLKTFEFEGVEPDASLRFLSYGVGEMEGPLLCKVSRVYRRA